MTLIEAAQREIDKRGRIAHVLSAMIAEAQRQFDQCATEKDRVLETFNKAYTEAIQTYDSAGFEAVKRREALIQLLNELEDKEVDVTGAIDGYLQTPVTVKRKKKWFQF